MWIRPAALAVLIAVTATSVRSLGAERTEPWIATARLVQDDQLSGAGVYLKSGMVITAAHLVNPSALTGVHLAGRNFAATVLKQGLFEDVDLSLLAVDGQLFAAAGIVLPEMNICEAPAWPGDPVIVVDAERATKSHIISPQILQFTLRRKFSSLIADVATTGNSGSGVFDPNRKCLLGIMSRKFTVQTQEGEKDIAKYFVPASEILEFLGSFASSK